MAKRTVFLIGMGALLLIATPFALIYGRIYVNEHLRVRDAEPAFRPIEKLGCEILSQPYGGRYCRYLVTFPPGSALTDSNVTTLNSLNHLPKANTLDIVIETDKLTDDSINQRAALETIDLLDVTASAISDDGIAQLKERMPDTHVNSR